MSPPSEGAIAISPPLGRVTDYPENIQLPKQLQEYFFLYNEYGKRTKSLRLDRAVEHLRSFYDYIDRETAVVRRGFGSGTGAFERPRRLSGSQEFSIYAKMMVLQKI